MTDKRVKVLVVDDDPDIVDYVSTLLTDHGYEVATAEGARAARQILEEFDADLLIVDVLLAGRSGLDLLVNLRQDQRWAELPIVVVTGNDQVVLDGARSYTDSVGRGADSVLGKPVVPDELLETVARLVA